MGSVLSSASLKEVQTLCINAWWAPDQWHSQTCAKYLILWSLARYQQNRPNVFCSCSLRNRRYFIFYFIFIILFFVCVFFRRAKASAKRAGSARHARRGKASMLSTYEQQTYFGSSLLSPRSDDRKYVCCSQATLAFARLKNAKKITPAMQAITPGPRLKLEFMKKNAQRQQSEGLVC